MKPLYEYEGKYVKLTTTNGNVFYGLVTDYIPPYDADEEEGEEESIIIRTTRENPGPFNEPGDYDAELSEIKDIEVIKEIPSTKE